MEQIISKEIAKKIMEIKGETRGVAPKSYGEFILKEEGEEGLKKLEDMMVELGYPIKYKEIEPMEFYPIGLVAVTLLAIKKIFNYDNNRFQEMGRFGSKIPLIIRIFMKYLGSIEMVVKGVPKMWKKYYTVGNLKVAEYDKEKKYIIVRLENFRLHPIHCQIPIGYFPTLLQMVVKGKVSCEETKCLFRNDEYHEFLLKW